MEQANPVNVVLKTLRDAYGKRFFGDFVPRHRVRDFAEMILAQLTSFLDMDDEAAHDELGHQIARAMVCIDRWTQGTVPDDDAYEAIAELCESFAEFDDSEMWGGAIGFEEEQTQLAILRHVVEYHMVHLDRRVCGDSNS